MILIPERQTLSDWLRIATWRLADSAKERIRSEIESHYNQAVEAHRENGLSEFAAHAAALEELGDPEAAAKRFRKQHLTESEAEKLEKSDKRARSIWNLLSYCFLFCLFVTPAFPFRPNILENYHSLPLYLATAFLVTLALPTACFLLARSSDARPNRPLLLVCSLSDCVRWPFFFLFFIGFNRALFERDPLYVCLAILYFALPIVQLVISLRLWMKLSKVRTTNLGRV